MHTFSVVGLVIVLALVSGCSKSEEKKTEAASPDAPASGGAVSHKDGITTIQLLAPGAQKKPTPAVATPDTAAGKSVAVASSAPEAGGKPETSGPGPAAKDARKTPAPPIVTTPLDPNKKSNGTMTIPQSGKVADVVQSGGYTYVRIDTEGWPLWLATSRLSVKTGDMVHWGQYTVMRNYFSKSLNQTFPMLLMVNEILPGSGPETSASASTNQGKAFAVFQAGGYTYIQLDSGTGPWLAVPSTQVNPGQVIAWTSGTVMRNFTSKTLNRTFEEIQFLGSITIK
ncbi:MAG: hypothetical protein HQL63_05195 [Magnetococcales bacterium]|nr:hypothetical protein [Magnetococcales bacterium]